MSLLHFLSDYLHVWIDILWGWWADGDCWIADFLGRVAGYASCIANNLLLYGQPCFDINIDGG